MKINVGCGYNWLKGYLNINSRENSLADEIMEAHCLKLESETADEIKASQLIEHLGFFKAKFFLGEAFRVLKKGGRLIIETPHIEKTFEIFLSGDDKIKETALGWIYGSESEGMNHIYCFPFGLLKTICLEAEIGRASCRERV